MEAESNAGKGRPGQGCLGKKILKLLQKGIAAAREEHSSWGQAYIAGAHLDFLYGQFAADFYAFHTLGDQGKGERDTVNQK